MYGIFFRFMAAGPVDSSALSSVVVHYPYSR
jgi:hypothetical protein